MAVLLSSLVTINSNSSLLDGNELRDPFSSFKNTLNSILFLTNLVKLIG